MAEATAPARAPRMSRSDLALGIGLGIVLGLVIVALFVFVFSNDTVDSASIDKHTATQQGKASP